MKGIQRIGLYVGLAIFGGWSVADAQTQPAAHRSTSSATRSGTSASATAARRSTSASYNRLTSRSRRGSADSSLRGTTGEAGGGGAYDEYDPLRPYSAQARRSAAAISPTRLSEAPPPPPRVAPPARYSYYPNMRPGQYPNANVPQMRRHCTPSRGGVMAGSLGRGR